MKDIFPITGYRGDFTSADSTTRSSLVTPTVNAWDFTQALMNFPIQVPQGERWLCHFHAESYIASPNVPTYQCGFGICLRGATRFDPSTWGGPGMYWHPCITAGDAAWGSASIDLWLNPGITVCNFGLIRDAGAITVMRRLIQAYPIMGMKV